MFQNLNLSLGTGISVFQGSTRQVEKVPKINRKLENVPKINRTAREGAHSAM